MSIPIAIVAAILAATASITPIDPPAAPAATLPALAAEAATTADKGHDVLMTWLEPGTDGVRLRFARFSDGSWMVPITVAEPVSVLDPSDPPSLTVIDTQAVRRTLIARAGDVVARSGDAGRTWTRLPSSALPFASFAGGDKGAYAFWLAADGDGSARLLGTRVLAGETLLDPRAAAGAGTAAAMTWDGPVVVYRDRDDDGGVGIASIRRESARWTPPRPVLAAARRKTEEPAGAPRIAAQRRRVAVVWHTDALRRPRVLAAFSRDAGRSFGAAVEVAAPADGQRPASALDVALADGDDALVLWTSARGSATALELTRVSADGARGAALTLVSELAPGAEGMPRLVRAGDHAVATWLEGEPARLRVARVPLAAIPPPAGGRGTAVAKSGGASEAKARRYYGRGRVGEGLPDLELATLDGETVSPAALAGRPMLLNVWATWCIPCRAEMPELAALHERYGPRGLEVVGVSVDDAAILDRVHAFVAERRIPFAIWLDPEMRLFRALRVKGLPVTFVLDRGGRILLRRDEPVEADDPELLDALRRALASVDERPAGTKKPGDRIPGR